MKKTLKKSLIILVMMLITFILCTGRVNAASASISSTGSVTVGQNVSVTINFGEKMKAIQFRLQYDTSKLDFVKVNVGGYGAGTQSFIYANSFDEADVSSVTFTFKSKASGTANFTASGFILSNAKQDGLSANTASAVTAIKEKEQPKPDPKPEPDPKPDPKPSTDKKPTFTSVNQKVYTTGSVNVRDNWDNGKILTTLSKDTSITRTGIGSNGWDRVTYNGRTAYISHNYLTTTKPKDKKDDEKDKNNTTNEVSNNTTNNEVANNTVNNETANNQTNDITNNETNEATNTQIQGNTEKSDKKGFSVNTIEIIIISVIILAIIVIIINEILAKRREEKRRAARKKDEKRVKGSRR